MLSDEQRKSLAYAVDQYHANVEQVIPYLEARGLGRDIALSERLGFVETPAIPGHKSGSGRLAIPYLTKAGPVAVTFRCIQDHNCKEFERELKKQHPNWRHSKYTKPSGTSTYLFGVNALFEAGRDIHVTEGELDRHTLHHRVSLPAVGVPGVDNWKPWWPEVFKDFRHVFVWSDGDEAGNLLFERFSKELGTRAIQVQVPDGHDVGSLFQLKGAEYMRGMVK